jgi:hypothetical protein
VTIDRFLDRFDPATYADDEPVCLFLVEGVGGDTEVWVPERLWHRLQAIASAYHLHLLPVLGWSRDPRFINAQQCQTLVDELEFVATVVDDALLNALIQELVKLCFGARGASRNALGVEHP